MIFPGGPPRAAISHEKLLPAMVGMLSESAVWLHSPTFAGSVSPTVLCVGRPSAGAVFGIVRDAV